MLVVRDPMILSYDLTESYDFFPGDLSFVVQAVWPWLVPMVQGNQLLLGCWWESQPLMLDPAR